MTALIVAIVGAVLCGPVAIVGLFMGNSERKAIREGRRDPAGEGKAVAAMVIGGIMLALTVVSILGIIALVALGGA